MSDSRPAIVKTPELMEAYGAKRVGDLERWLRRDGVPYKIGRNGPWTTPEALNAALGVAYKKQRQGVELL